MTKKNFNLSSKLDALQYLFYISIALACLAYWGGLSDLVTRWNAQEEYGHGYFIPLIALWFLWHRRQALIDSIGQPSMLGPVFILIGAIGLLLGETTAIYILIQFGFIIALIGCVLAFGGYSLLKVSLLPILFLIFAIPLPYFIDSQLSWRLQIVSSNLGVEVLRLLGNSVYLEGNVIDLGVYKLQVVEACSGLRYLYPLLSIGFLMAYMYKAALWKRVVIFLSTIPITIVMNSIRIAMVGVLVNAWGPEQAEGFVHYFEGWIIFMACLLILVAEIYIFEWFGQKRGFNTAVDLPEISAVKSKSGLFSATPLYMNIGLLLLSLITVYSLTEREEIKPNRKSFVSFPLQISGWKANVSNLEKDVIQTLKLDDYFIADYMKENFGKVNFYVAYYVSQRKGASPHSPQVCMPGGGWVISSIDRIVLSAGDKKEFPVNRVIINKDGYKQLVYYWFEQRGRHITGQYEMKWYLLLDAIQKNRTDGSLVRLTTLIKPNESLEEADKRIQSFLDVTIPELKQFVPE